jgi:hypothetical protein
MKKIGLLCGIVSVFVFALTSQAQSGMAGDGPRHHYSKMWDARTVETQKGEVVTVEKYVPGRGGPASGLRLTMKTDRETIVVVLGPVSYVEGQQFKIEPKDRLEIKGSRMSVDGQSTMIAAEVKKGDKTLKLRDEAGSPLWSGAKQIFPDVSVKESRR